MLPFHDEVLSSLRFLSSLIVLSWMQVQQFSLVPCSGGRRTSSLCAITQISQAADLIHASLKNLPVHGCSRVYDERNRLQLTIRITPASWRREMQIRLVKELGVRGNSGDKHFTSQDKQRV
jgi:hypothetical protein